MKHWTVPLSDSFVILVDMHPVDQADMVTDRGREQTDWGASDHQGLVDIRKVQVAAGKASQRDPEEDMVHVMVQEGDREKQTGLGRIDGSSAAVAGHRREEAPFPARPTPPHRGG